jgi:hypothetical protein
MKIQKLPLPLALALIAGTSLLSLTYVASAQHQHSAKDHASHGESSSGELAKNVDTRTLVEFPSQMRLHTLASMRDHLLAVSEIQAALAKGAYDNAADVAEQRLGMSSLKAHGAHDSSKFMPQGMRDVGTSMHRAASRFAIEAKNASATGELKPSLEALSAVTKACVACHAGYRLQ